MPQNGPRNPAQDDPKTQRAKLRQAIAHLEDQRSSPGDADQLLQQFTRLWWSLDSTPPAFERPYSSKEQKRNEGLLQHALHVLDRETGQAHATKREQRASQQRIVAAWVDFARAALGITDRHVEALQAYGFTAAAREFYEQARQYDPSITAADIFQASRNVWSMNLIQLLLGLPVQVTPAVFAYSMLYPYSDNYLDDPAISADAKNAFNRRFRQRLKGARIRPPNDHEARISELIAMIEAQYDRHRYPQVYAGLLAIQDSQSHSMKLLDADLSPYEIDLLGICFAKGGASVLADGYLVAGDLTAQQREFVFFYGTFTQLVDDLEDVERDLTAGLMTIYALTARHWPLDRLANRTFQYGLKFLNCLDGFEGDYLSPLKEAIRLSLFPVLSLSAGSLGRYYTRPYLRHLQAHFPVRFSYANKLRKKLARRGFSPLGLVEIFARYGTGPTHPH
jgi:hypothetical protein